MSCDIALHVESVTGVGFEIAESSNVSLGIGGSMYAVGTPYYEGSYEVTPSNQAQTLPMSGLRAKADVIVKPIPSNYGLVTYNGSVITVS